MATVTAEYYDLWESACSSDELDRIIEDMRRHKKAGRYVSERTERSVFRFVVEPVAIRLHAQSGAPGKWFEKYPTKLRAEVAAAIVRSWEREL